MGVHLKTSHFPISSASNLWLTYFGSGGFCVMKTESNKTLVRGLLLMAAMVVITLALLVNSGQGSSRANRSDAAAIAAAVAHYQMAVTQDHAGHSPRITLPLSRGTMFFSEYGPPAIGTRVWEPRHFFFDVDGTLRVDHSSDFLGTPPGLHLIDMSR